MTDQKHGSAIGISLAVFARERQRLLSPFARMWLIRSVEAWRSTES